MASWFKKTMSVGVSFLLRSIDVWKKCMRMQKLPKEKSKKVVNNELKINRLETIYYSEVVYGGDIWGIHFLKH